MESNLDYRILRYITARCFDCFGEKLFLIFVTAVRTMDQLFNFDVIGTYSFVDIFLDETEADQDHSKELSISEALYLGIALSLDSLASGLAYGIGVVNFGLLLGCSFGFGVVLIVVGSALGKRLMCRFTGDVSWLSGCLLMILALLRLG